MLNRKQLNSNIMSQTPKGIKGTDTATGEVKTLDPKQLERAAFILKNIAHPTRLAILQLLHANERLPVSEICERIKVEQSLTSHHLSNMKIIGILSANRDGKNVYYSLKESSVIDIISCLESISING